MNFSLRMKAIARPATSLRLFLCLLFLCMWMVPALMNAQLAGKGAVSGTVLDPSGAAVPGATIVITNDSTSIATTTTSTSAGDYTAPALDPGIYTVTVTASGFEKQTQKQVHVNALETQTYNPKLTVGSTGSEVTVSAAPPALETTNATLGATMENEMYAALPLQMNAGGQSSQRRATDFVFLMPGVQGNNTSGNATTNSGIVNGSGSRGAVSGIYFDGVIFTRAGGQGDPRFVWTAVAVDAVDQFQVQTNGYSAIYEGQGVQNFNIKQGGNRYHGSVYEFFRNTALDTWGFFGANSVNPFTGLSRKPVEHQNEYGINLSGPLVPFGSWKDKVFFFGNYNRYKLRSESPVAITFPTPAEQAGNFQGVQTGGIFDPYTQTACTANSTTGPCRYRYGYIAGGAAGAAGNPVLGPAGAAGVDVIPASEFSSVALKSQSFLPGGIGTANQNNYLSSNPDGRDNWSTTERIDITLSPKDTVSLVAAIGRQASIFAAGQSTSGRNVGPLPYNYGQAFAPKTAVGIVEEVHVFSPHVVNQLKYGYGRYDGPTFDADNRPAYSAGSVLGISNTPVGQASTAFPIVSFAGTNAPTQWGGTTANLVIAQNFTLLDNVQWQLGKHSLTIGGQLAWLNYDQIPATGGSSPVTLSNAVTETAALNPSTNAKPSYAATANTGAAYASYLVGQIDKTSFTTYTVQEFGSRFRAISPYIQDNWKVTSKLTLDLGLRYDYFPTLRENRDNQSFFNPTLANPVTGLPGALQFAGNGANTCNCSTPVSQYYKNIGPRLGLAYQLDSSTVLRASYGVMFTHGNGVGGSNSSVTGSASNALGFSASPSFSASGTLLSTAPFNGANGAIPAYGAAAGRASGPQYGTGYTTTAGYTGTPSTVAYYDPYLGSRAPEFINWSVGLQHQWTPNFVTTATYVGSQGHFLLADGSNARGFYADQLDPKYLALGSNLNLTGTALTNYCATTPGVCPSSLSVFNTSQSLATLLKPFPFQNTTDFFSNVSNANYHAIQVVANMRATHHVTFMANYTWSRAIDDTGQFRSGYAIPAGAIYNNPSSYAQDRIERTVSTSSQPHKVVITGVWDLPFGRDIAASHAWERAVLGGFKFSEIFQAFSGSPLNITAATCGTNPAQGVCLPSINPAFTNPGNARINGKHWGQGVTRSNYNTVSFINSAAFTTTPAYQFGNVSRTAPYGLTGPGNYELDIALVRSFKLHITEAARFDFRAEYYNVTNHTQFLVTGNSLVFGNAQFGQVAPNPAATRRSAQFSGRLSF
jgi:hypothetical protein